MTAMYAPATYEQAKAAGWAHNYIFAAERMRMALEDSLDAMALGTVPLLGDLSGSGSDTIRIRSVGGIGWNRRFQTLASETDTATPSAFDAGYTEVAVAPVALAHSESYLNQSLNGGRNWITLDELKALVPVSWLATWRYKMAVVGATFSTAVGSASRAMMVDDVIDLRAAARTSKATGKRLGGLVDPNQINQLLESIRSEPAFQNSKMDFESVQGTDQQILRNVLGLNIDLGVTDDVVQDAGAYQGFAGTDGSIGWAVASSSPIKVANPQGAIYIPQFGLVIEEQVGGQGQGVRGYQARAAFGLAKASNTGVTTHFQRRIISKV